MMAQWESAYLTSLRRSSNPLSPHESKAGGLGSLSVTPAMGAGTGHSCELQVEREVGRG